MCRPDPTIDLTDAEKRDLSRDRLTTAWTDWAVDFDDIFGNDTMTIVPVSIG